jgi:hypothetical protein
VSLTCPSVMGVAALFGTHTPSPQSQPHMDTNTRTTKTGTHANTVSGAVRSVLSSVLSVLVMWPPNTSAQTKNGQRQWKRWNGQQELNAHAFRRHGCG